MHVAHHMPKISRLTFRFPTCWGTAPIPATRRILLRPRPVPVLKRQRDDVFSFWKYPVLPLHGWWCFCWNHVFLLVWIFWIEPPFSVYSVFWKKSLYNSIRTRTSCFFSFFSVCLRNVYMAGPSYNHLSYLSSPFGFIQSVKTKSGRKRPAHLLAFF